MNDNLIIYKERVIISWHIFAYTKLNINLNAMQNMMKERNMKQKEIERTNVRYPLLILTSPRFRYFGKLLSAGIPSSPFQRIRRMKWKTIGSNLTWIVG